MMDEKVRLMKRVDVQSTLLMISIGGTVFIKTNVIKASSIRSAIRVLNQKGYQFVCSEKGLIDKVKIMRIR